MRVRKMNQVDVKLHDLTKVKLEKYRLNWEETGIRCRGSETGWRDWIIRQFKEENWRSYWSEPFFLEENQDTLFSDVIEKPFCWCRKCFGMYQNV